MTSTREAPRRTGLPPAAIWLLAGTVVTTVGNAMHTFTLGLMLYADSGSPAAFGFVIILEQVLTVVMQLVAGPWVDRGDPRITALAVEAGRGLAIIGSAVAIGMGGPVMLWVMVMTVAIKVGQPFYRAATFALGPALVEPDALARFNGWSNTGLQAGQLVGVVVAAPAYALLGAPGTFAINGASFLASGLTLWWMARHVHRLPTADDRPRVPLTPAAAVREMARSWGEIWALLRTRASLTWLLVLNSADAVAVQLFNLLSVPLIALRFHGSPYWLTVVECCFAVGALATGPAVDPLTRRFGARPVAVLGIAGQAVCFAAVAAVPQGWLVLVLCGGLGAFNTISWAVLMTALQLNADRAVRGRVGVSRNLVTAVLTVALVPLVSRLADLSLVGATVASGAVCAFFAVAIVVVGGRRVLGARLFGERSAWEAAS